MARDYTLRKDRAAAFQEAVPAAVPVAHLYALNWAGAIAAGIWGTFVMALMMYYVPPLMDMPPMDIGTMLGTMFLPQDKAAAFWIGLGVHFMNGTIFALAYAAILLALRTQSTAGTGVGLGLATWLGGAMLLLVPILEIHPLVQSGEMKNPGYFMLDMGMGWTPALLSLATHLVYGVIVGLLYKHHIRA